MIRFGFVLFLSCWCACGYDDGEVADNTDSKVGKTEVDIPGNPRIHYQKASAFYDNNDALPSVSC